MKFVVHSATPVTAAVPATTKAGTEITGQMPALNVELVPADGVGKTITLELTEENWSGPDPKELFAVGSTVELGFTPVKA